jgi:AcrR family transcriptional regulator
MSPSTNDATPRERILRAAHDLFYREGIRATGIDRVIALSGVAKLTFYRQFASKDELVLAFLEVRHQRWMAWFVEALARHGGTPAAIAPTLAEWFSSDDYRGCAFLNSVGELGPALPAVLEAARRHKKEMTAAVARLMRPAPGRARRARALALAIDGAIVQAQYLASADAAVEALAFVVKAVDGGRGRSGGTTAAVAPT